MNLSLPQFLFCFYLVILLNCSFSAKALADDQLGSVGVRAGSQLYQQYCSACHGLSGTGNGPAAVALKKPPADLTQIAKRRDGTFPKSEIIQYIDGRMSVDAHGTREMPIWGSKFSELTGGGEFGDESARGKVTTLVEYLESIQVR